LIPVSTRPTTAAIRVVRRSVGRAQQISTATAIRVRSGSGRATGEPVISRVMVTHRQL
jgi:hypothetical protein